MAAALRVDIHMVRPLDAPKHPTGLLQLLDKFCAVHGGYYNHSQEKAKRSKRFCLSRLYRFPTESLCNSVDKTKKARRSRRCRAGVFLVRRSRADQDGGPRASPCWLAFKSMDNVPNQHVIRDQLTTTAPTLALVKHRHIGTHLESVQIAGLHVFRQLERNTSLDQSGNHASPAALAAIEVRCPNL